MRKSYQEENVKTEYAEELVRQLLVHIGEDPSREGLIETPKRIVKMYKEIFAGYITPCPDMKCFTSKVTSMVVKSGVLTFSHCEHHAVPMKLYVDFAYIPNGKVVGISKIIRLIRWCSARLTLQEELVENIADEFMEQVNPAGCMVVIRGHHFCEEMRGVRTENCTTTSAIRGVFEEDRNVQKEALSLMKEGCN